MFQRHVLKSDDNTEIRIGKDNNTDKDNEIDRGNEVEKTAFRISRIDAKMELERWHRELDDARFLEWWKHALGHAHDNNHEDQSEIAASDQT
eukprot:SAG31_NODE_41478_length_276_cov_0.570621_1_plen_91_part_11